MVYGYEARFIMTDRRQARAKAAVAGVMLASGSLTNPVMMRTTVMTATRAAPGVVTSAYSNNKQFKEYARKRQELEKRNNG